MMFTKLVPALGLVLLAVLLLGCGTTKSKLATEQLIMSDAVDRAVAAIDFRPLRDTKVYLDTQYVNAVKGMGFVNADYIISSLRQQMVACRCQLEEKREDADFIVEVRVGALGKDSHEVTYGIPPSNSISHAASLVPNAPSIPVLPEVSLARKSDDLGAAKIVAFAYHRESRQPVWQSGISQSKSTAKDTWVFGVGPFQSGTVRGETQLAGESIPLIGDSRSDESPIPADRRRRRIPLADDAPCNDSIDPWDTYGKQVTFVPDPHELNSRGSAVQQASFEEPPPAPVTAPPAASDPPAELPSDADANKPAPTPAAPAKPPTTKPAKE